MNIVFFKRIAIIAMLLALPVFAPVSAQTVDALGVVTDIVVGHNNKGPYVLSWTEIDPNTVSVSLSGRALRKNADYSLDTEEGMISFNSILLNDVIVRVSYMTTEESKETSGKLSVPVSVSLLDSQKGKLSVTGLYAQNDSDNPEAGNTVVGVSGDRQWSGGKVESQFLMSQRNDESLEDDQSSSWERSALKFGNTTSIGQLKLTGSYQRTGKDFAGANEYGLQAGQQAIDIAGVYDICSSFQATFKFQDKQETADEEAGVYSRLNEQGMTFAPADATKISLSHSVTETGNSLTDGSDKTVESSKVQINQNVGANTNAVVCLENVNVTEGDTVDQIQTRETTVSTSALQGVDVKGTLTQKDSQLDGAEESISTAVTVSPISQVDVQAGYTKKDSVKEGKSATTDLSVKFKPVDNIEFQGRLIDQTEDESEQYQRDLSLTATPINNTKLTALFQQKGVDESDDVTKGAELEVSPFYRTKIAAGFKSIESGNIVTTVRDYSASAEPWRFFKFSGSFRDRQGAQDLEVDTKKVNLALLPLDFLKLTGDYQENPEDKNGNVQAYKKKAMGVTFQFGSVGVSTNYAAKDEYLSCRLSDERKFGLEVPAFGHGKLSTGYKIKRLFDGTSSESNTYSLGYKHSLGSDFSLSLTGYYTQYLQNQMTTPERAEYKSELNLGIKF